MAREPGHREIAAELEALAGHGPVTPVGPDRVTSFKTSGRPYYGVSVPDQRRLVRRWLTEHRDWPPERIRRSVRSLLAASPYEEKTIGCLILAARRDVRALVSPSQVASWLEDLRGWAEVDSLCQATFDADELLADWRSWRSTILGLSRSENINQRRAALVLLTNPVRRSSDERLLSLSLTVINQLRTERDPLITKAVSWLLRSMTVNHSVVVSDYLDRHGSELAPIAVRETRTKLVTGTKSGRSGQERSNVGR